MPCAGHEFLFLVNVDFECPFVDLHGDKGLELFDISEEKQISCDLFIVGHVGNINNQQKVKVPSNVVDLLNLWVTGESFLDFVKQIKALVLEFDFDYDCDWTTYSNWIYNADIEFYDASGFQSSNAAIDC